MLLIMGVSLYTSRVILATIGIVDYGVYNVVSSIVTMFIFIRSALGNATNRYIAFYIGKGDLHKQKQIFSTCIIIHLILAIIIIILCETIGLWLFYHKLIIPEERSVAAFWAFQFSILTCAIGIMCVPYDAEIIAHEKMNAFAYISILDVSLKLVIVYIIAHVNFDKLIFYSFLIFLIQLIDRIIYKYYCKIKFEETVITYCVDKSLIKEMFLFASWNILGNMAAIACTPILNILLNMFFGPIVNAARGIAIQVQGAVKNFISNFQLAVIPQITKTYAKDNIERMNELIISCSKFSYFLFFCIALPIYIKTEQILNLWLVEVPDHTVNFIRLILLIMLIESWEQPLHTANLATGELKKFQTFKGLSLLCIIPISYMALKFGAPSEYVFVIQLIITFLSLLIQLLIIKPIINLPIHKYMNEVFIRSFLVTIISLIPSFFIAQILRNNFGHLILVCLICMTIVLLSIYLIGLNRKERRIVTEKIKVLKNLGKRFH